MTRSPRLAALAAFVLASVFAAEASAAGVRVTCEVRATRSKVSIDGRGLAAGDYTTRAVSGANAAASDPVAAVGGEVETDYDSNPADIADGAVPIAADFIQGGKVTGEVIDASGAVVARRTAACRVRK